MSILCLATLFLFFLTIPSTTVSMALPPLFNADSTSSHFSFFLALFYPKQTIICVFLLPSALLVPLQFSPDVGLSMKHFAKPFYHIPKAADNQLYVATCSPARDAGSGYVAWGHSTLVGPFGEVLATTEHEEATIISEIDYSQIELRRTNLPLENQRRGDLYKLVDVQRLNSQC